MNTKECIMYDGIVELGIATPEEINLVRCIICGSWEEILRKIIFARTGYYTIEQYFESELEEVKED